MSKTIVINGHRNPKDSVFGKALFESALTLPEVTGHTLITTYPDYKVDGEKERTLLDQHANVVLQFPFYWYSSPAIVKEWLDEVLSRGWAYAGGQALAGKKLMLAVTTGGPEKVYQNGGANQFTMDEFLRPFEQTANMCGMKWQDPFVMFGVHYLDENEIKKKCLSYQQKIQNLCRKEDRF
jgi:glutathione-regulated potassium-efflux system ancillary protein KefG